MLCFEPGFDLINNTKFCPTERNALKEFYDSAKGREWTVDTNWMDHYVEHCDWYGISCNDANNTISLKLQGNGLSGTLTPNIANLRSLEVLDLNNNNIKVRHVVVHAMREISHETFLFLNSIICVILILIQPGLNSQRDWLTLESHSAQIELQ